MSIHVSTNKFMDVKFIAQGLDPERSHPIGGIIIDAFNLSLLKIEEVIFDCISALICTVHQKRLSTN